MSFRVRLLGVSAYKRCLLTRGVHLREVKKSRFLVEKSPGLWFGVQLWEVSTYWIGGVL